MKMTALNPVMQLKIMQTPAASQGKVMEAIENDSALSESGGSGTTTLFSSVTAAAQDESYRHSFELYA